MSPKHWTASYSAPIVAITYVRHAGSCVSLSTREKYQDFLARCFFFPCHAANCFHFSSFHVLHHTTQERVFLPSPTHPSSKPTSWTSPSSTYQEVAVQEGSLCHPNQTSGVRSTSAKSSPKPSRALAHSIQRHRGRGGQILQNLGRRPKRAAGGHWRVRREDGGADPQQEARGKDGCSRGGQKAIKRVSARGSPRNYARIFHAGHGTNTQEDDPG